MMWTRQTYSLLDWLGDLGGLIDIMIYIGRALVEPVSRFTLQSALMASFFRFKRDSKPNQNMHKKNKVATDTQVETLNVESKKQKEPLADIVKREFLASQKIPLLGFFAVNCFCCFSFRKAQKYRQILNKSKSRLEKEMDLQKFLHRQRVLVTSLLGLLKGRQNAFVDKFSQLLIRESSDMGQTSSDAELSDWGK